MSKNIRIGYSGFISFGSRILSLFTGLIFITLVTRNLTQYDFGLWQLILSIVSYAVLPNVVVDYWILRDIARGQREATTALLFSLIIASGGLAMYILISTFSAPRVGGQFLFFVVAMAQVPLSYLSITLQTVSQAARPQSVGVAFMVFESVKVAVAALSFFVFGINLNVAITAVLLALVAQCIVLLAMQPRYLYKRSFSREAVSRWLKMSWLPAFATFAGYIGTVDSLLVTAITASTLVLANYRAANVIAAMVSHASAFAVALYPKLIGGAATEVSRYVMTLTMMFTIPMSAGIFVLSIPLLSILGPSYGSAYMVLWIGIPITAIGSVHQIFEAVLMGHEKVDVSQKSSFRDYSKSRLITVPSITLFGSIISLAALAVVTYWLNSLHASPVTMAVAWSAIVICISSPGLIIKWRMMKRSKTTFSIPWKNIAIYGGASAVMVAALVATGATNIRHSSTIDLVLKLTAYLALGSAVYFGILFALDSTFRLLVFKSIDMAKAVIAPRGRTPASDSSAA